MSAYLRNRLPEFILCVGMTLGLNMAVLSGWVLTDSFSGSLLVTAEVVAVIVAVLYLLAYNRLTVGIGVFLGVVLAAATLAYLRVADPLADETANSEFMFFLVSVCVSVLTFLLTRTKSGTIVALAAGTLVTAGAKFLEFPTPLGAFLLFLGCSLAMVLMRVYAATMRRAFAGMVRAGRYFAQSAGVVTVAGLLACLVFFAVIVPLNPPTRDLELISMLRTMETMSVFGVSQTHEVYDPDLLSSGLIADHRDGNQEGDEEGDEEEGTAADSQRENEQDSDGGESSANAQDQWENNPNLQEMLQAVRFEQVEMGAIIVVLLVVAALAALIGGKLALRRRWHRRVDALPAADAVINYYRFFLKRFARIGLGKAPATTLTEYAALMEHALQPFAVGDATFGRLTAIYLRTFYGNETPTAEEAAFFGQFYDGFYQNARRHLGTFKYLRKFFRL